MTNIVNGRVAPEKVNVDDALQIGQKMSAEFLSGLPKGFYKPIKKRVITMESAKKSVKVGSGNAYDAEKIYARLLIISQKREIDLPGLFKYELAPVPSSLFDDYCEMRKGTKSVLLSKIAVFTSTQMEPVDLELVDGNEALYHTLWPKMGSTKQFAEGFCRSRSKRHSCYVIFDKYIPGSTKSHERARRARGIKTPLHNLTAESPLPSRDVVMKSDYNKKQLIRVICSINHGFPHLVLIGEEQCLFKHEEADVNIISYLLFLKESKSHIQVIADDTDIFMLLVYYVWKHKVKTQISMRLHDRRVIDINKTVCHLGNCCKDLLPMHALSGCDTMSYPYGKGKITAVNLLLKNNLNLEQMCDGNTPIKEIDRVGTNFLVCLYGGKPGNDLNYLRYHLFSKRKDPTKIKCLPPTYESAIHHVRRAYYQTMTWCAADSDGPPDLNITNFGWEMKDTQPEPFPIAGSAAVAPASILKVVACSCKSQPSCATNRCTCRAAGLPCTTYCKCEEDSDCEN